MNSVHGSNVLLDLTVNLFYRLLRDAKKRVSPIISTYDRIVTMDWYLNVNWNPYGDIRQKLRAIKILQFYTMISVF